MSAVGFDFGSETCYAAIAKGGGIEVVDNEYSQRMTPSYVGFTENNRDIGVTAKTKLLPNFNNTVFCIKTVLGKKYHECFDDRPYLPFDVCELLSRELGVRVKYLNRKVVFSAEQIAAMMLTKLKAITEVNLGSSIRDCVISVPVFYTDAQRRSMLNAAEIAGLKVLKLMNEPTAVALSYGFYRQEMFEKPKNVVFVDMGHTSLTITACKFFKDSQKILGSVWNTKLGGRSFDEILLHHFVEDFKNRYHIDVMRKKKAVLQLYLECESLKKQMSMNSRELELNIECFMEDIDVRGKMSRDLFEQLSSTLLSKIAKLLTDLLEKTSLAVGDISEVQVVGGSSRLPALKTIIRNVFGVEPQATLNQDEAVARGCALQCAFLSPLLKTRQYLIEDIQPYSIHIICRRGDLEDRMELFPVFHKVPATKQVTITYKSPFTLDIYYSNPKNPEIGWYTLEIPSDVEIPENSDVRIEIRFSIGMKGILYIPSAHLLVKQEDSNAAAAMQVVPANDDGKSASENISTDDTTTPAADGENQPEDLAALEGKVTVYNMTIKDTFPRLSERELLAWVEKEQEMIRTDLHAKQMADLRNVVEEYVYYSREKLTTNLKDYISEAALGNFLALLLSVEEWLYNSDCPKASDYSQKLDELKKDIDPVFEWYSQLEDAKSAMNSFQKVLEGVSTIVFDTEKNPNATDADLSSLNGILAQGRQLFGQWMGLLKEAKACDGHVTSEQINLEAEEIKFKVHTVLTKLELRGIAGGDISDDATVSDANASEGAKPEEENVAGNQSPRNSQLGDMDTN